MKLMALLAAAVVTAGAVTVWRTRHGVEVWHTAPDAPA